MSASVAQDGRHARSERTRVSIVDAYLDLLAEGVVPASAEIAGRAGITQRTLFNQFGDMKSMNLAAGQRQFELIANRLPVVPPSGPVQERVTHYVRELTPLLEDIAPVRWMVWREHQLPSHGRPLLDRIRQLMLDRLAGVVEPELRQLDGAREDTLLALEIATDPLTWRLMRVQQQLDVESATRVMTRAVLGLLRDRRAPLALARLD